VALLNWLMREVCSSMALPRACTSSLSASIISGAGGPGLGEATGEYCQHACIEPIGLGEQAMASANSRARNGLTDAHRIAMVNQIAVEVAMPFSCRLDCDQLPRHDAPADG